MPPGADCLGLDRVQLVDHLLKLAVLSLLSSTCTNPLLSHTGGQDFEQEIVVYPGLITLFNAINLIVTVAQSVNGITSVEANQVEVKDP